MFGDRGMIQAKDSRNCPSKGSLLESFFIALVKTIIVYLCALIKYLEKKDFSKIQEDI